MTDRYDVIVIGAGHNGIVCATLLARAGKTVLLLEASSEAGGAAVTRGFAEGYRVSACAHLLYQLQPAVSKAMGLTIPVAADDLWTIVLAEDGHHVRYRGGDVDGVSAGDADEFRAFFRLMSRFAGVLGTQLNAIPPRLGTSSKRDLARLAKLGFDIRRLGKHDMREFLRMIGMNIRDELVERFDSALLRGGISADAVFGTHLGPRSPSSILTYLYRLAGTGGRLTQPAGGLGSVTAGMLEAARSAGVVVKTDMPVADIVVENGRVTGVRAEDGSVFDSLTVVSGADPKKTVLDLVGARHFEAPFVRRVRHLRTRGNAAKLHLALDGLPSVAGLSDTELGNRLLVAPDEDYVERAFNPAKYGQFSPEPVIEVTIPSIADPVLAPSGRHVVSAVFQYAPHDLKAGWDRKARSDVQSAVMDSLEKYMPGLGGHVTASELLLPPDLEREFGMTGGHWHHAELSFDQFLFVRPVPGAAQYQLPLEGLYLCGAGAHPGGGVTGAAGRNAADAILAKDKVRWL